MHMLTQREQWGPCLFIGNNGAPSYLYKTMGSMLAYREQWCTFLPIGNNEAHACSWGKLGPHYCLWAHALKDFRKWNRSSSSPAICWTPKMYSGQLYLKPGSFLSHGSEADEPQNKSRWVAMIICL